MKSSFFGLALVLGLSGLLPGFVNEASGDQFMTAYVKWLAPTTGEPAVRYLVQIRDLDGPPNEDYMEYTVDAVPGSEQRFAFTKVEYVHRYQARVAGTDARGRQGVWSGWSLVYDKESSDPQR
jgi:hypothetical protein